MKKIMIAISITTSLLAGCASVPMDSPEKNKLAKQFNPPSDGNSGLYIYRASGVGTALKKDIWVDEKCVGETAPNMFFFE